METVDLQLESKIKCLDQVHETIAQLGCSQGWAEENVFHIKLVLSEALTNIIRHGYKGQSGNPIRLIFEASPAKVVMTIRDQGTPFDIERQPEADLDPWKEHGRGIFLINRLMDEVHSSREEEWNQLILVKKMD